MAFFDKLNQVAKNIGDKTGDAIEIGKLNSKIKAEQAAAAEDFKQIGEYYYNLFLVQGNAVPEVLDFCQSAKAHFDAIAEAQSKIDRIKAENEAPATIVSAAPAAGLACPACGVANTPGTKFCCSCGTKLEPVQPQERKCPSCGKTVAAGVRFCSECGQRMED